MKESVIQHVTQKMKKIRISKLPRDKKYLISQETRDFIKSTDKEYLGILPIKYTTLPIRNPKKEFFLHQTSIMTLQKEMICLPVKKSKTKCKIKIIQEYLQKEIQLDISTDKINKILDVENSKIQIYIVNLSNFKLFPQEKNKELIKNINVDLIEDIENLSLEPHIYLDKLEKKNFQFQKMLDFYNEIKVRDSIRDMYDNIGKLKQNKYILQKCIVMNIPASTNQIQFKYRFIYSRIL